ARGHAARVAGAAAVRAGTHLRRRRVHGGAGRTALSRPAVLARRRAGAGTGAGAPRLRRGAQDLALMNKFVLWFHRIGSPPTAHRLAGAIGPWMYVAGAVLGLLALYGGLVLAPADYQQGDAFRIIYVHVPCA